MQNNKVIKNISKKILRKNYWRSVAVTFLIAIIIGSFNMGATNILENKLQNLFPFFNSLNLNIAKETIERIPIVNLHSINNNATRGFFAITFNNVTASGSFIFGLLNSLNQLIFHERIWASIIIFLGAILSFLYWYFIRNVLIVGENRFFLENINHPNTHIKRILMPYKVLKYKNVSRVMLKKYLSIFLWSFTVVGGIIKYYSYYLVSYILAENPDIDSKTALKLSEDMMNGHKWQLFLLELSLIIWSILDTLTFHLIGILYYYPYKKNTLALFYINVRKLAKEKNINNTNLLKDDYLEIKSNSYPIDKYMYKEIESKFKLNTNYLQSYELTSLILMFFAISIIGWLWEVLFHLFNYGSFVNRGTLHGPWLPIYGWGAIIVLITLKKYRKSPEKTFLLTMTLCGLIEYSTSLYLEIFKHARWWDYDGYFLNIKGRICLEGLILFGIGGCAFIYFIAPVLETIFRKINKKIKIIICVILTLLYLGDIIYTSNNPNEGNGISQKLEN